MYAHGISLAVNSGALWIAATTRDTSQEFYTEVWVCTTACSRSLILNEGGGYLTEKLTTLTGGKMSLVSSEDGGGDNLLFDMWNGSAWLGVRYSSTYNSLEDGSCVALGDTTECVLDSGGGSLTANFYSIPFAATSWPSPLPLGSASFASIGTDGQTLAVAMSGGSSNYVSYTTSQDGGLTWASAQTLTSFQTAVKYVTASPSLNGSLRFAGTAGGSSPYYVEYASIPISIPTAATSNDPWSRPGLSPYESYFSEFSDYLSPGNGLVGVEVGTLNLPGRGLDFVPSLIYSEPYAFWSSGSPFLYDNYTGANLGPGWSLNFPWLGTDYLHLSDGQAFPYSWNGSTFQYNGVEDFVLTLNSGEAYTLTMASGTVYQFDTSKRLSSITDSTGNNTVSFSYGTNGYVSQVTDSISRVVSFSYNSNGQLSEIASGGRTWTLGYAGAQLTSLTDPLSRVTAFQYDGSSGAGAWLLTAVVWPTGGEVTYAYASALVGTEVSTYYATLRNVYYDPTHLSLSQNISYTTEGQVMWANTTVSNATTVRSRLDISFQSSKNMMKGYSYDGSGALQKVTETNSDAAGHTNATKTYSPSGVLLAESTSDYDNWGNLVHSEGNVGQQEWFSYANTNSSDAFGSSGCTTSFYNQTVSSSIHDLMVGSCDYQNGAGSAQQQTYYECDQAGNLVSQKALHDGGWLVSNFTYDSYGDQLTAANPDGVTTDYTYSSTYGHAYLTRTNVSDGTQDVATSYAYDLATGNKLSETNPDGYTTTYQYDALGRTTQVTSPAVNGVYAVTKYSYDDANNVLTTTGPDGHVTKSYFDGLARVTEVKQMKGCCVYSTTHYTYNWLDKVASKTTPTGHTYAYSYDWDGRLTKAANPGGTFVTTTYNITANTKTVTDENGHPTVYHYDRNEKLTSVKEYNSSSAFYLTTYAYDLSGSIVSSTDAMGQATTYQYDDLNRLVKTTFPDGTYETKAYDPVGNLLTRTTANGSTISYSYDALNRPTEVTYPGSGGTVTYSYDAAGNRLSQLSPSAADYYAYDPMGRLTNQTEYVSGAKYTTLYAYDNASNVVQITYPDGYALTLTYDPLNRLKTVGSFATLQYTLDGKVSTISFGNGEVQTYTYDGRDRPTQIKDGYGGNVLMLLTYTYDGAGNVLTESSNSYGYDWLNRLTSASGPWGNVTYSYDGAGNRVQMVNGSTLTGYTYTPLNRLASAGSVNYTYDANGNTVAKSGGWAYTYDYADRLTGVSRNGATVQSNSYDGDGNRVLQALGNSSMVYSYQGVDVLYQQNLTSGVATKFFYAGALPVAEMVGSGVYYLHGDSLGSVRMATTPSASISFSSEYTPYGGSYALVGVEALMYTGKLLDPTTGLYYEGARYYDPKTGRFITEDSVAGIKTDPVTMNRYVYAADDPMRYVDPTGHMLAAAPGGGGTASSTTCTTSPDVCASESGANAASLVTVSPGISAKPPDVELTQGGSDQYTNEPTTRPKSSFICSGSTSYCSVIDYGGTNPYLKIGLGSLVILGVVAIVVYVRGSAAPAFLPSPGDGFVPTGTTTAVPEPPGVPGLGTVFIIGFDLVYSGFADFGCERAGACSQ